MSPGRTAEPVCGSSVGRVVCATTACVARATVVDVPQILFPIVLQSQQGLVLLAPVVGQLRHTASVLEHDYVRSSKFTRCVGHHGLHVKSCQNPVAAW